MTPDEPRADGAPPRQVAIYALLLLALLATLIPRLADFWRWSASVIASPTGADYGEGIVWEQFLGLVQGQAFGSIQGLPAIVYHYPPIYYLVTAAVEPFARDGLQAGRIVSFVATIATALLLALMTRRLAGTRAHPVVAWICGALSAAIFLHFSFVAYWAPLMRVDPLAVLFTIGGMLCGMAALKKPRMIYACALLFVLAVYTKQTSMVAPIAVFGVLLFVRPSLAVRGIAASVAFGLALLGVMLFATEGRFLKHIVEYNVNRFSLGNLGHNLMVAKLMLDTTFLAFAGGSVVLLALDLLGRRRWSPESRDHNAAMAMLLCFIVLKTASLVALGKFGASTNYWIEWLAPISVAAGLGLYACFKASLAPDGDGRGYSLRAVLLLLLPVVLAAGQLFSNHPLLPNLHADEAPEQRLIATARNCSGWVIGDDMVAILRAGKRVVWEPAIFAELAAMGVYDERPVMDALKSGKVCAVIMENNPALVKSRFRPAVLAAIEASNPHRYTVGKWLVFYR